MTKEEALSIAKEIDESFMKGLSVDTQELVQDIYEDFESRSCLTCNLVYECPTAKETKKATGMKFSEMCFSCWEGKKE
jgi:hypothetical protein